MAGQARRDTRARGRSSRAAASWPLLAAASGDASGSAIATATSATQLSMTAALPTRTTYRNLLMRGLAPEEAAKLTAFLAGIPVHDVTTAWTLRQVNQLLFLREMNRTGQFAETIDGQVH